MNFKKYFTDALLGNEKHIKDFGGFLLDTKIADCVDELLIMHASFVDRLGLPEDETKKLKDLHEALMPFGLNYWLAYITKGEDNYPFSVRIVKAGRDPEPSSQALDFEEIESITKALRFFLDYKDILAEPDEPTEFNEVLNSLRMAELMTAEASNCNSGSGFSQGNNEINAERKITELKKRAAKLLGGRIYKHQPRDQRPRFIYDRSARHLYGCQVFTKKNALCPKQKQESTRQWKFYLDELDILEAFIEHDEEILRELRAEHGE